MVTPEEPIGIELYFQKLQEKLLSGLGLATVLPHPGGVGDEAEVNWLEMLEQHLPRRYQAIPKCHVVDHTGAVSDEIDIVLCDRQYSTLVLHAEARQMVPAESVYAVFEAKPRISRDHVLYAANKVASVRRLERTNAGITWAGGHIDEPRKPSRILGGLLTVGSDWNPALGDSFRTALADQNPDGALDFGCVLTYAGWKSFHNEAPPTFMASVAEQALVTFYLNLLQELQEFGTVPAIDYYAWGKTLQQRPAD